MVKGIRFGEVHSFDDLNLILSKVDLPPAAVKTNFVDNPGGDGSWDLTEANGKVNYKDRKAKFTFSVLPQDDFEAKKTEVSNLLNGRRFKITLDKDPAYYWDGRCSINKYESNKKLRKIVVEANVAPYKLKQEKTRVFVPLCGKNLFDKNNLPLIYGGAGCTLSTLNSGVRVSWTEGQWTSYVAKFLPIQMLLGETITLSANLVAVGGVKPCIIIGYVSADGKRRLQKVEIKETGCVSLDIGEDAAAYDNLGIWLYANAGADPASVSEGAYVDYTNITIELGNTVEERRNLIPYLFAEAFTNNQLKRNGITYTDNLNGTITVNGTATGQSYLMLWSEPKLPIGNYALSGCPAGGSGGTYFMTGNGYTVTKTDIGNGGLLSVEEDSPQTNFVIVVQSGTTVNNLVFKPQLEKGTVSTPFTPYVQFEAYTPTAPKGKNLYNLDAGLSAALVKTDTGYKFTKDSASGSTTMSGGYVNCYIPANTPFTISFKNADLSNLSHDTFLSFQLFMPDKGAGEYPAFWKTDLRSDGSIVKPLVYPYAITQVRFYMTYPANGDYFTFDSIQIEIGSAMTEHEPFISSVDVSLTNGRKTVSPTIICTDEANFNVDGSEFTVGEGTHKVLDFSLEEGETTVTLYGSGAAAIVYQEGDL